MTISDLPRWLRRTPRLFRRSGRLDIIFSPETVIVYPSSSATSPHEGSATAAGSVVLHLTETTKIGTISVLLTCEATLHATGSDSLDVDINHSHRKLILKEGESIMTEGRHIFNFAFRLGASSPSSVTAQDFGLSYRLEATCGEPDLKASRTFNVLAVEMDDGYEPYETRVNGFEPSLGPYRISLPTVKATIGEHLPIGIELPCPTPELSFQQYSASIEQLIVGTEQSRKIELFRSTPCCPPNSGDVTRERVWPSIGSDGISFLHLSQMPTCSEQLLRPSTSELTRSPVRLIHRLELELQFRMADQQQRVLRATLMPFTVLSCQLRTIEIFPPAYSLELPPRTASKERRCACEMVRVETSVSLSTSRDFKSM